MLQIRPIGPHTGAEITGVDMKAIDDAGFNPVYRAFLDRGVIVVRDQDFAPDDYIRYSQRFGYVVTHPSKSTRHPDHAKITLMGVNKFDAQGNVIDAVYRRGAENFHTDGAYDEVPFKATQMYALAVPSQGGNTLFSNMYTAWDRLPQRLKDLLTGRRASFCYGGRRRDQELLSPKTATGRPCSTRWRRCIPRRDAPRSTSTPARSSPSKAWSRRGAMTSSTS